MIKEEILIFVKGPDSDLEAIESLLLGANQHLDALQNPLHSDERPQPDEAASLLDTNNVHHYELELTKEAIQSLRDDPKTYVKGTFKYKDDLYENVGVKLKGKWGSFRIIQGDSKPAFTIKFNAFTKDQRFFGFARSGGICFLQRSGTGGTQGGSCDVEGEWRGLRLVCSG